MKCVTFKLLVLILMLLMTLFGFQIYSKKIHYKATYNCGLSDGYTDDKPIIRRIPDTRDNRCPRKFYNLAKYNAKVSIIITYHNEYLATLLLTIYSICKRTPLEYLQEIIVIDDCSVNDIIVNSLQNILKLPENNNLSLIKTVRNAKRLGLIKSRNLGAKLSLGNYLMFMDSHCEVNEQWLEALLETTFSSTDSKVAVSPLLDAIDDISWEYRATSAFIKGGFDWNLHFHWFAREKTLSPISPFRSPTFAGGMFLISRNWFFKLKAFNTRLETWGGESLDFSLKLWLCGGDKAEIKIVPCSRVGHVFRKEHLFQFPDNDGQNTYLRNSKIIAETWLDHYKHNFYNLRPAARNIFVNFSQAEVKHFKDAMKCQAFEWYLQNIFPELRNAENYTANGVLTSSGSLELNLCLHQESDENYQFKLTMINCFHPNITHWFLLTNTHLLQTDKGLCLNIKTLPNASVRKFEVVLENCLYSREQNWQRSGLQLRHLVTGLCLETTVDFNLTMNPCRTRATIKILSLSENWKKCKMQMKQE